MLVDSHCHLDFDTFQDELDAVVQRAHDGGVRTCVSIGTRLDKFPGVRAIAERFPDVWCSVGVHPHEAESEPLGNAEILIEHAKHPKVVGIGETGLDYYYDNSPRAAQQDAFRQFINLARQLRLPLVVHLRDAYDDAVSIMREEHAADVGGVIHCFSGDRAEARAFLDLGFELSFSGIVTFKNADELRAVARMVPADRFMVETDAPFLTPVPLRGKRNEPAYVVLTAAAVAGVRQQRLDEVAALASANARRCFRLPNAAS
jgi:TatD DNase family protein